MRMKSKCLKYGKKQINSLCNTMQPMMIIPEGSGASGLL